MLKIKNIIIYAAIGVVLILIYVFFIKSPPPEESLISTSQSGAVDSSDTLGQEPSLTKDFLSLLLSVKKIKLDAAIFSEPAFSNLRDSSIVLTPDGTEGRANPFAPIGSDTITAPANIPTPTPTPTPTPSAVTP